MYVLDQNRTLWHYDAIKMRLDINHLSSLYKKFSNSSVVGAIDDHKVTWFFKGIDQTMQNKIFE